MTEDQMDALRDWIAKALTVHTEDDTCRKGSVEREPIYTTIGDETFYEGYSVDVYGSDAVWNPEVREAEKAFAALFNKESGV